MKYSNKLADKLAQIYGSGETGVKEMCDEFGITTQTFYEWKKTKTYFSDAISYYENLRLENLGRMAISGIALMITKHEYIEEKIDYVAVKGKKGEKDKQVVKGISRTRKTFMPNPALLQFVANNRLPQQWKTASSIDHTNNGGSFGFSNFLTKTKPTDSEEEEDVYTPDHRENETTQTAE